MQQIKGGYTGINVPWLLAFSSDALMGPDNLLPELQEQEDREKGTKKK
jgi:predicted nucleic acid-binding protein